jgi:hypothetical protein
MADKQLIDVNQEAKVGKAVIRNKTGAGIAVLQAEDGALEIVACCIGEETQ